MPTRRPCGDALSVQPGVQRIGSPWVAGVKIVPTSREHAVVVVAAERARSVARGERCRLVEEEQLGELSGLQKLAALPPAKLEPAGDPPPAVEAPPDHAVPIVQAAAVAVDEAAAGVDEPAERGHPVAARHPVSLGLGSNGGDTRTRPGCGVV